MMLKFRYSIRGSKSGAERRVTKPKKRPATFWAWLFLPVLLLTSTPQLRALTPQEADSSIQKGLAANSRLDAPDSFLITQFSSRLATMKRVFAGARSGEEYSLLIRSCRQLLAYMAYQSKGDRSIDVSGVRSSCLDQDRIWIVLDEGERKAMKPRRLEGLIMRSGRTAAKAVSSSVVTDIAVWLDGAEVAPIEENHLEELGPGSTMAVFEAKAFKTATEGRVKVNIVSRTDEREREVAVVDTSLLRRLFE